MFQKKFFLKDKEACIVALPPCGSDKENKWKTNLGDEQMILPKDFKNSKELRLLYCARTRGIIVK